MMLRAAARVAESAPEVRFSVACLRPRNAQLASQILDRSGMAVPNLTIHHGRTPELMRLADCAWAVSGSISLELMHQTLPTVIVYKLNRLDLLIARPFIKSRFITLVNLLADAELMPEFLTTVDVSRELAAQAIRWLDDPRERARAANSLAALRDKVARPGASERAAERIAAAMGIRSGPIPIAYRGPHLASTSSEAPRPLILRP